MFFFSKKRNVKTLLNYCIAKYCNSFVVNKNDDMLKRKILNSNLHFVKKDISNIFIERIKTVFNKFKKKGLDDEISDVCKALVFYENTNIKYTENLYKEILMCMNVLHYKDEEVDKELNYLHNHFKNKRSDLDPYILCENNVKNIDEHIVNIIKTNYKNIDEFVTYINTYQGKKFRIVLGILLKNILSLVDNMDSKNNFKFRNIQRKLTQSHINKNYTSKRSQKINFSNHISKEQIIENQCRIIAASEIIHMGSLLHDDVIDGANKRRGILTLHKKYSNKISILSGDFLLARAGSVFASTGNPEICKRFAYVIESLIKGEFLQINLNFNNIEDAMKMYLIKSYHKTASLFSHLFACIAILSFKSESIIRLCFNLGLHIGMAFQLYDDYLDYQIDKTSNKLILSDLKNNVKTAPLLFSYNYDPDIILSLVNKKYLSNHDINDILFYIKSTNSLKKNKLCSLLHIKKAIDILSLLISHCKFTNNKEKCYMEKEKINENSTALINLILNILSRTNK